MYQERASQSLLSSLASLWCQANKIWREYVVVIVIGGGEEKVIANSELNDDTAKVDNAEDRAEE